MGGFENNLIDSILERENMDHAWEQIQANMGAPGADGVTLARWKRNWEANIERLQMQVKANTYRANRPRRFAVRKKGGGTRELSILTVTDKVLQRAVVNVIDDLFDIRFLKCSHGYRKNRSVATALQQVIHLREKAYLWVVDADIKACFDNIDHEILMCLVNKVIKDWFVINLMTIWLKAGRKKINQPVGIPMGAVISPLWCNVYLHQLDAFMLCNRWKMVRYADDFVIMTKSFEEAQTALRIVNDRLKKLKLVLHEEKTSITNFERGFTFLGVHFEGDRYQYHHASKKIEVEGADVKMLWNYIPDFYGGWKR